jgi:hypothetical protein
VLGVGTYTWAYGTSDPNDPTTGNYLARVDNNSLVLDSNNYLAASGLASITDMSIASDGRIVLTGKDGANSTSYAYIDSSGTIIPSSRPPVFKLSQALSL